ncbi:hypothetical protein VPHK479_0074 [Vibrio phage K479]
MTFVILFDNLLPAARGNVKKSCHWGFFSLLP